MRAMRLQALEKAEDARQRAEDEKKAGETQAEKQKQMNEAEQQMNVLFEKSKCERRTLINRIADYIANPTNPMENQREKDSLRMVPEVVSALAKGVLAHQKECVPSQRFHMVLVEDDSCGKIALGRTWDFRYPNGERYRIVAVNGTHAHKYWKELPESMQCVSRPFEFPCVLTLQSENTENLTEIEQAKAMEYVWQNFASLKKTEQRDGRMVNVDTFDKPYLMLCAQTNRWREVQRIVNKFPKDVDGCAAVKALLRAEDDDGYNAIMLAAESGCLKTVEVLVNIDPDSDHVFHVGKSANRKGFMSPYESTEDSYAEMSEDSVNSLEGGEGLSSDDMCSSVGGDEAPKVCGGEKSFSISDKITALSLAVEVGRNDVAEFLLLKKCKDSQTPLMLAAESGYLDVVKFLLAKCEGSDLLLKDGENKTALCYAASNGHVDVVRQLLQVNSSPEHLEIKDNQGFTALRHAAEEKHENVFEVMMEFNASMHEDVVEVMMKPDDTGMTALHKAVKNRQPNMVRSLSSNSGLDRINHFDFEGHAARHLVEKDLAKEQFHHKKDGVSDELLKKAESIKKLEEMQKDLKQNGAWDFKHDQTCVACYLEKKDNFEEDWLHLDCCGKSSLCMPCVLGLLRSDYTRSNCSTGCNGESKKLKDIKNKMDIPLRLPAGCQWKATLRDTDEDATKHYVHVEAVRDGMKYKKHGGKDECSIVNVEAKETVQWALESAVWISECDLDHNKSWSRRFTHAMIEWLKLGKAVANERTGAGFPHFDICQTTDDGNWQIQNVNRGHEEFGFADGYGYFVADGDLVFGDSLQAFAKDFTTSASAPCDEAIWSHFDELGDKLKSEATIKPRIHVKQPDVTKKVEDNTPILDVNETIALEVEQVIDHALKKCNRQEFVELQALYKNEDLQKDYKNDKLYELLNNKVGDEIEEIKHKVEDIIRNSAGSTTSASEPIKPAKCHCCNSH